jgi:membrane protein
LLSGVGSLSGSLGITLRVVSFLASMAINIGAFMLAFRLATARTVRFGDFARSAVIAAVVWQALLAAVSLLVAHEVSHQQELYGTVGVVLGLLAWLHLQSVLTLLAVESDVVRARRLWPRSVTPPPLTRADRRTYRAYARTTMRLPEEEMTVDVSFTTPAAPTDPPAAEIPAEAPPAEGPQSDVVV